MGPRHSKRSLDMAGTPTKSEIEGVGNAGKLEKIVDGLVEKVSANGHVDAELQNGAEPLQNGLEPVQNGEAAAVALDHSPEKIKLDEREEAGINNETEDKLNGEIDEKIPDAEGKEDKKDKKKEKKEKVVKKKFSFRSFSFSKKDKNKPKEEKVTETKEKAGIEETAEKLGDYIEEKVDETKEAMVESEGKDIASTVEVALNETLRENTVVTPVLVMSVDATVTEATVPELSDLKPLEKIAAADDLPPPLPASPPPSEMKEEIVVQEKERKIEMTEDIHADSKEVNAIVEVMEANNEVLTASEQLEEKATDLLKTVEEKVEESKRKDLETALNNSNCDSKDDVEDNLSHTSTDIINDGSSSTVLADSLSKTEESLSKTVSGPVILSANTEENIDKQEEFGAGESLAEMDASSEPALNINEVTAAD